MKTKRETEFLEALKKLPGLCCLWEVGRKRRSSKDTIDLLAGYDCGRFSEHVLRIRSLFKEHYPGADLHTCDDGVRFSLPTWRGGIAICNTRSLTRQINGWIHGKDLGGKHKPWATGYWLPEALCGDLVTANCLQDTNCTNNRVMGILQPYPISLSKSIEELCVSEVRQRVLIAKQLSGNMGSVELNLCVTDISAALVRLAFARSTVYFRGFRVLEVQARKLKASDLPIYKLAVELSRSKKLSERQIARISVHL